MNEKPFEQQPQQLFETAQEQTQRLLTVNDNVWKRLDITESAIRSAGEPPECPASDEKHLYCVTLLYEADSPVETFNKNLQAFFALHTPNVWPSPQPQHPVWAGFNQFSDGIRQRSSAIARRQGLRWQICELGRTYENIGVVEALDIMDRDRVMVMGQELPLVAAMHPNWVRTMCSDKGSPTVLAPDIEVAVNGEFQCIVRADFNNKRNQAAITDWQISQPISRGVGCGHLP